MTRIDKEAQKAKKESQRAIQYPRIPEPVVKKKVRKAKKKK
ncbi:MAG: hypothetical protein ACYSSI_00110 [Planctomycetota bacterium]|jgi:hypothetical protein